MMMIWFIYFGSIFRSDPNYPGSQHHHGYMRRYEMVDSVQPRGCCGYICSPDQGSPAKYYS